VIRPLGLAGLLALAAPVAAGAQEVVRGVVREAGSGHPVSGAQVGTLPRGPIAWTDSEGRFHLTVTSRPDSLRIIAIGYGATRLALVEATHAFYLGKELAKARLAITLGKTYRQEGELSWGYLTPPEPGDASSTARRESRLRAARERADRRRAASRRQTTRH